MTFKIPSKLSNKIQSQFHTLWEPGSQQEVPVCILLAVWDLAIEKYCSSCITKMNVWLGHKKISEEAVVATCSYYIKEPTGLQIGGLGSRTELHQWRYHNTYDKKLRSRSHSAGFGSRWILDLESWKFLKLQILRTNITTFFSKKFKNLPKKKL